MRFTGIDREITLTVEAAGEVIGRITPQFLTDSVVRNSSPMIQLARSMVSRHRRTGSLEEAIMVDAGKPTAKTAQVAFGIGRLQRSMRVTDRKTGETYRRQVIPWNYSRFIEEGFHNKKTGRAVPADPYMVPAFDRSVDHLVDAVGLDIERELAR
jgi:hypothetical protein